MEHLRAALGLAVTFSRIADVDEGSFGSFVVVDQKRPNLLRPFARAPLGFHVALMAWNPHAIAQSQLWTLQLAR